MKVLNVGPDQTPPDGNCLHCHLAPVIQDFANSHPGYEDTRVIVDVSIVLGELMGSALYNIGRPQDLEGVMERVTREVRRSAVELMATMEKNKRG